MSSYLFIPGNNPGMLQTAEVFQAKGLIFDLEDAVSIVDKDSAKALVYEFLKVRKLNNVYIRINDLTTTGIDEISSFNELSIKGYIVPKADLLTINQVRELTDKDLIALIETPKGVIELEEIVKIDSIVGLMLGGEDLAKELEVIRTLEDVELMYAKQKLALVAHSKKIEAIDTPFTYIDDTEGLVKKTNDAKALGFTAKACIHPNQVHYVNNCFKPSDEEIEFAIKVIKQLKIIDKGVFSIDGIMVDLPVIARAKNTLKKAEIDENSL